MYIAGAAMFCSVLIFVLLICSKRVMKSAFLILLAITVSFYMIGNYIEIVNETLEASKVGLMVRFMAVPFIPTLWYFCVREFCGLKFKNWHMYVLFLIAPVIIAYLAFTWEQNHLLILGVEYINRRNNGNLLVAYGPLNGIRMAYQFCIDLLGFLTILRCYRNGTKRFKKQSILFLISVLIPLFNSATYIIHAGRYDMDITPYGLLLSMIIFTWALYRVGVINLSDVIKEGVMDHLHEGVLLLDRYGTYMASNASAREVLPELKGIKLGTNIDEMEYLPFRISDIDSVKEYKQGQRYSCDQQGCEFSREYNGATDTFKASVSPIYLHKSILGYSVIINNITSIKKLMSDLEGKSVTDSLTGLYNRGYMFEAGQGIMREAKQNHEPFCVIMLDVDHFKMANDRYGHPFGDYVLKTIAQICVGSFRKSDIVARYGGEEFCVLLGHTTLETARSKAEALRMKVAGQPLESEGVKAQFTASFGVAEIQPEDMELEDIIKRADANLYQSKARGRNRVT